MIIKVLQDEIDRGVQESPTDCPVAIAIANYGIQDIMVSSLRFCHLTSGDEAPTPDPVRRRIEYYDRTGKMKPFSFELPAKLEPKNRKPQCRLISGQAS